MPFIRKRLALATVATLLVGAGLFRMYDKSRLHVKPVDMKKKLVVITGGNRGIGKETVRDLALNNADVIIGCRDVETGNKFVSELKKSNVKSNISVVKLDLANLQSVNDFAKYVLSLDQPIHYLINNAGMLDENQKKTSDNNMWMYQVNYLSHFLLTNLLLKNITKTAEKGDECRIVNVSSQLHYTGKVDLPLFSDGRVRSSLSGYADSKLLNILFSNQLNKRLQGKNVISVSLHPGYVASEFSDQLVWWNKYLNYFAYALIGRTEKEGAVTTLHTIYSPKIEGGGYYDSCALDTPHQAAKDQKICEQVWELSEKQLNKSM